MNKVTQQQLALVFYAPAVLIGINNLRDEVWEAIKHKNLDPILNASYLIEAALILMLTLYLGITRYLIQSSSPLTYDNFSFGLDIIEAIAIAGFFLNLGQNSLFPEYRWVSAYLGILLITLCVIASHTHLGNWDKQDKEDRL